MLQIVTSIYKMTDQMVNLAEDENTPEKVGIFSFSCALRIDTYGL
jgi:hypothetical protein